jgi:hypothetical protein
MRHSIILLSLLFGSVIPAAAQVSVGVGIGFPNLSIGINVPAYPQLEPVPGYPVYYAPQLPANFFFYDGMYWAYQDDNWYASSWYNGPWALVSPMVVPVYILRVPVRYYRVVPVYFRGWPPDAPPRWGDHWGNDWQRQRSGWDQWNRSAVPAPAPLPTYQRPYSGSRYPSFEQQRTITSQNYIYRPHDPVVQQHYQRYVASNASAPSEQRQPQRQPQQSSGQDHRPADQVSDTSKPPRPTEQQPSRQEHRPSDQLSNSSKPPKPADQPPSGQEHVAPGQVASTSKPPQEQHHQQPTVQEHSPPDQREQASKEPKQNPGGDQSGDKRPDKEEQQNNR